MSDLADEVQAENLKENKDAAKQTNPKNWYKSNYKWAADAELPLMMHLSRATHLVTQKLEAEVKLSTPQIRILFEALDPKGVSQSFLGKRHKVDPAAITRTVQAMERDGLITRRQDANDNRFVRVYITDKGRALIEAMPPQLQRFEQELVVGWSEDEIKQLHSLLDKLEQRLGISQIIENYQKEREAD